MIILHYFVKRVNDSYSFLISDYLKFTYYSYYSYYASPCGVAIYHAGERYVTEGLQLANTHSIPNFFSTLFRKRITAVVSFISVTSPVPYIL